VEIVRTPEEIDALCRRAKAAVQATKRGKLAVEVGYAYGIYDALRWILGLPHAAPADEIEPVTAEEIESLLDRLHD
jgi:hypothetical protein